MAQSGFEQLMSTLGYNLDEVKGMKLTYKKNAKYSTLVLIIDLELKYINPILVPKSVILYEKDITFMLTEFYDMRNDAKIIAEKTENTFQILN